MRRKGFTLIELLIVMTLLGLAISIVIPNIETLYEKIQFRSQTKKIYELVLKARFHSFYYQKNIVLSSEQSRLIVRGLELPADQIPTIPVELSQEISFSPNGVSSGGEIRLYFRGRPKATITIETFSGRAALKLL